MLMNAIGPWLFAGGKGNVISRHFSYKQTDIFVIGLQEMVDLTATTVVSESQSMKRSQTWIDAISSVLNESVRFPFLSFFLSQHQGNSYYCVASKILVGVFLCVFARVSLKPSISRVFSTSVSTFRRSFERGHGSSRDDGQQRRRWNSIRSEQLLALLSLLPSRCTSRESLRSKRRLPQVGNRGIPHN